MTEQRRLAAILVADVVGYSKLIGSDEAGTLAVQKGSVDAYYGDRWHPDLFAHRRHRRSPWHHSGVGRAQARGSEGSPSLAAAHNPECAVDAVRALYKQVVGQDAPLGI
jgi:class 3 adenylate cyclase